MTDIEIEDILVETTKKKKVNSKKKGNRAELEITKILTARFNKPFSRSIGSGNRYSQTTLVSHAKMTLTGDICVPEDFLWVIECKNGYSDIDLNGVFQGLATLDTFINQSNRDSEQSGRKSLIVWKRAFRPWLAMVKNFSCEYKYRFYYRDWVIVGLEDLLKEPDNFWFKNE